MADLSIIIASHDGAKSLPRCLAALEAQSSHSASVEYVLVNNASSDATGAVMRAFTDTMGGTTLCEPRQGKSFALNLALDHAQGDIILFLDDDILPGEGWLQAYYHAFEAHPDVGLFAGSLRPDWPEMPTDWQQGLADTGHSFGTTPISTSAGPCTIALVRGGNFGVRRSAIGSTRFDETTSNWGDIAGAVGGEDTRFASDIAESGAVIHFLQSAGAQHIVKPHETSITSIITRYRRMGRGSAAQRNNLAVWLTAPFMLIAFSLLAGLAMIFGRKTFAATQMTRAANRLGRLEFVASRLRSTDRH